MDSPNLMTLQVPCSRELVANAAFDPTVLFAPLAVAEARRQYPGCLVQAEPGYRLCSPLEVLALGGYDGVVIETRWRIVEPGQ